MGFVVSGNERNWSFYWCGVINCSGPIKPLPYGVKNMIVASDDQLARSGRSPDGSRNMALRSGTSGSERQAHDTARQRDLVIWQARIREWQEQLEEMASDGAAMSPSVVFDVQSRIARYKEKCREAAMGTKLSGLEITHRKSHSAADSHSNQPSLESKGVDTGQIGPGAAATVANRSKAVDAVFALLGAGTWDV